MSSTIALAVGVLGSGAVLVATAGSQAMLLLALFLLRLGGQGLTGHLAIVAAVSFGGPRAGRGVSTAAFGFILGEAWLLGNASLTLIAVTCAVYAVVVPLLAHSMMNAATQRRAAEP